MLMVCIHLHTLVRQSTYAMPQFTCKYGIMCNLFRVYLRNAGNEAGSGSQKDIILKLGDLRYNANLASKYKALI